MTVKVTAPPVNLREKLSELDKPSGIAGQDILKADTPQEVFNYIGAGRRNLIINGAMQVAQRGTSFTGLTAGGTYTVDRWLLDGTHDATLTVEQSSDAPEGFGSSLKLTATTADSSATGTQWCGFTQRFEGQDIQHFNFATSNAKQITVSFWVKASTTGTAVLAFYQDDGASYYGQQYTINSANTWEYKTLVVSLPTTGTVIPNDNSRALRMYFTVLGGPDTQSGSTETWGNATNWLVGQDNFIGTTNATFQFTGVQLEVGSVATPFEHRSYGEELALCQRYYIEWKDQGDQQGNFNTTCTANDTVSGYKDLPVTMRIPPTVTSTSLYHSVGGLTNGVRTVNSTGSQIDQIFVRVDWTHTEADSHTGVLYTQSGHYVRADAEL